MSFTYAEDMESLTFTSGSVEFTADETLTGAVSGATATIKDWDLTSGSWVGGDAAGTAWISALVGTFQAEALSGSIGGADMITASGASSPGYSSLNWVRARIDDMDSSYPKFTDTEIKAVITKCTSGSTVNFDHVLGIVLETLSVDPIRVVQSRMKVSGGIAMLDELELYAKRSEVYTD